MQLSSHNIELNSTKSIQLQDHPIEQLSRKDLSPQGGQYPTRVGFADQNTFGCSKTSYSNETVPFVCPTNSIYDDRCTQRVPELRSNRQAQRTNELYQSTCAKDVSQIDKYSCSVYDDLNHERSHYRAECNRPLNAACQTPTPLESCAPLGQPVGCNSKKFPANTTDAKGVMSIARDATRNRKTGTKHNFGTIKFAKRLEGTAPKGCLSSYRATQNADCQAPHDRKAISNLKGSVCVCGINNAYYCFECYQVCCSECSHLLHKSECISKQTGKINELVDEMTNKVKQLVQTSKHITEILRNILYLEIENNDILIIIDQLKHIKMQQMWGNSQLQLVSNLRTSAARQCVVTIMQLKQFPNFVTDFDKFCAEFTENTVYSLRQSVNNASSQLKQLSKLIEKVQETSKKVKETSKDIEKIVQPLSYDITDPDSYLQAQLMSNEYDGQYLLKR